jgi:hypothetical protein
MRLSNQANYAWGQTFRFVLGSAIVMAAVSNAAAQSLAEVAKREAERRGTVTKSGKVYTNSSLVEDFTKPVTPVPAVAAPAPKTEAAPAAGTTKPEEEPLQVPVAAPGTEVERQAPSDKGEDYYRGKATIFRNAIAAQKAQIAALETRVASLSEAKTGTDLRERDLSSQALQKAKADLASIEEDRARFEAIARAKNAPSAWWQR